MNRIFVLLILCTVFFISCSDDKNDNPAPVEVNKYITGIDLSKSFNVGKAFSTFENEVFHALGYGYDITGKYAHPDWIRKKVVDAQMLEDDYYDDVIHNWRVFSHRGLGTITGTEDEVKIEILKRMAMDTDEKLLKYKNLFKDIFDIPFVSDTTFMSEEYFYAIDAFVSGWYEHYFLLFSKEDIERLGNYVTDEFRRDLETKTAEEIILAYGTHVMVDIEVGWRQDYCFRATSDNELQKRMTYASAKFLGSTPGIWSSPAPHVYDDKENIYTEYISGLDALNKPTSWMFDITNYSDELKFEYRKHDIDNKSLVLVNWGDRSSFGTFGPIIPIYEFVQDANKKIALQDAYDTYLSK